MKRYFIGLFCLALGMVFVFGYSTATWAQGNYSVAILVVDDFGGVNLSEVEGGESGDNCAVNLEGQAYVTRGAVAEGATTLTHGELVYGQLEQMIGEFGAESFVTLVEVDIQGVTTEVAVERITQAITDNPADYYVVNMSIAIIPCEFISAMADMETQLQDAQNKKDKNKHRGLFERAVIFYDGTVFPVNSQKFQEATDLDPLQQLLADLSDNVVAVASAGNFGLDYPFWPAAWGQVVSVSASTGEDFYAPSSWDKRNNAPLLGADTEQKGKKGTRISNFGEVMLPGEYSTDEGMVIGTSFAAPRMSMVMALYLSAVGNAYCRNSVGGPALASGEWDNLTLSEAVDAYCPDMAAYLP
jgi:hypothetical protein